METGKKNLHSKNKNFSKGRLRQADSKESMMVKKKGTTEENRFCDRSNGYNLLYQE